MNRAHSSALILTKSIYKLKNKRNHIRLSRILILGLLILDTLPLEARERLFLLRGTTLHTLNPETGEEIQSRHVGDANILRPTPGGKYVFALNTSTGLGEAVDFEDLSQAKQVSLSGQTPLEQFEFSPMGHDIFTQGPAGLEAWDHKAGELSSPETLPFPPAAGAPAFNSRGTRIYLPRSGSLDYGLLAEGRILRQVETPAGITNWKAAPGGRYLWGTGPRGLAILDERRNRVTEYFEWPGTAPAAFDSLERHGWVLSNSGQTLRVLDVRRQRVLAEHRLPSAAIGPAPSGEQEGVWLVLNARLHFYTTDGRQKETNLPGSGEVKALVTVTLKPSRGFACF